jgi:hypothetical protein
MCAWLVGAVGPASAAVTSSSVTVTSPAGTYLIDDQVTPNETITVTGTSDGGGSDAVDINCYSGPMGVKLLALDVPVKADGTFTFSGPLPGIAKETCVLRAVPHGDTTPIPPGITSPYNGPTLAIGQRSNVPAGNGRALESYNLDVPQLDGGFQYGSLGQCPILSSFTYDPVTFASATLDDCNASFDSFNGETPAVVGVLTPTRSELQVDGIDAYLAGNAAALFTGAQNNAGYPSMTYGYSIDPATGDLALNETDQVVECSPAPAAYPPTASSCTSFVPAGVQVGLHIVQTDGGRMATVTQYFSSADAAPHTVDLLEDNEFSHVNADGAVDFPWTGAAMQPYTIPGQVIVGPGVGGPGSFLVKGDGPAPDGSESAPQGSVTFSNPPDRIVVIAATNNSSGVSWFDLHYSRTVPATGSVALGFTYSTAFLAGEVASDAAGAQAAFHPTVAITSPGIGAVASQPQATVSGVAGDANGLSSLIVNGQAVAVAPTGAWATAVALAPGSNTITAIATNVFGNTAEAQLTLVYTPATSTSPSPTPTPTPTSPSPSQTPTPTPTSPLPAPAQHLPAPQAPSLVLGQSHRTWREGGRAGKGRPPVGTMFSITLDQPASVLLTFTQARTGRRLDGRCAAETKRNRHRPACTHIAVVGTLSRTAAVGPNAISFGGNVGNGRKLAPGRYTVTVAATNQLTGVRSVLRRVTFTIVK